LQPYLETESALQYLWHHHPQQWSNTMTMRPHKHAYVNNSNYRLTV